MFLDDAFPRIAKGQQSNLTPTKLYEIITPVNIQNTTEYFWENVNEFMDQDGGLNELNFPNVSLSWPVCWFEWKSPEGINFGVLLTETRFKDPVTVMDALDEYGDQVSRMMERKNLNPSLGDIYYNDTNGGNIIKSLVNAMCFIRLPEENIVRIPDAVAYCHDKDGRMMGDWTFVFKQDEDGFGGYTWLGPVWYALSIIHCKNTVIESSTPIPEKLQKSRIKRKKAPLFQVKTIKINPAQMKNGTKIYQGNSLPNTLHICRGHFKDFSKGKGLFGKHKGLFWWDMHTRGNEENGTIIKTYEVETGGKSRKKGY